MEIALLINRQIMSKYVQVANSVFDDVLNMHIRDAQIVDLAPLLGEKLFNSVMNETSTHQNLIKGMPYTYNGEAFVNYGLEIVLSYFTYARIKRFGNITETPFGSVTKLGGNESQPANQKILIDMAEQYRQSANTYFDSVAAFMNRTNYPLWKDNKCVAADKPKNFSNSSFTILGK